MRINCDANGTIIGNPCCVAEACLQAVQRLGEAGHEVVLCSGFPEGAGDLVGGAKVRDKISIINAGPDGAVLIDDDPMILSAWMRRGGIGVPAAQLLRFAAALVGQP